MGRALIPRLLADGTERVVSVSRDEVKADALAVDLAHTNLRVFLGDVRDQQRLEQVFAGCDTVIHAAALKRVTSGYSPSEMIKTNIGGTINVIQAAKEAGCSRVLFISSDKAVHATNLYGATKFTAECYAVQSNSYTFPAGLRVSCTRYGNVLGSRGSVTEAWAAIPESDPLPITSSLMTRFMITRTQAVDFILQALEAMRGGEVFIPLLQGFQVYDLMRALYPERAIKHVGLRSGGEKLHERLVSDEEWGRLYQTQWGTMILPSFNTWGAPGAWAEHPLMLRSNEFRFHSDRAERLTVEQLGEICRESL
mgnify:CR=1 FL=1